MNTFTDSMTHTAASTSQRDMGTLVARLLLAAIFLIAGLGKLSSVEATTGYIASVGLPLPDMLFWGTVALEVVGGVLLLIGFKARLASLTLGLFTLAAAVIFHNDFADQTQMTMFLKNLAIAGGLFMVALHGPGRLSIDRG